MIIVDTNVISEPLRSRPDAGVVSWLDEQPVETLFLTTITLAELRFGVSTLSEGRRRRQLEERIEGVVLPLFAGRVLAFDEPASAAYARLRATARAAGRAIGTTDAYIAAIALDHGHAVATRDAAAFEAAGVEVINPFDQ